VNAIQLLSTPAPAIAIVASSQFTVAFLDPRQSRTFAEARNELNEHGGNARIGQAVDCCNICAVIIPVQLKRGRHKSRRSNNKQRQKAYYSHAEGMKRSKGGLEETRPISEIDIM
jgi:hypothetical protein